MTEDSCYIKDFASASALIGVGSTAPNYNLSFHKEGKEIGKLDFNGPTMVFTGDFDESAKVFFQWIAELFQTRLERERAEEREACAEVCETPGLGAKFQGDVYANAIRARGDE